MTIPHLKHLSSLVCVAFLLHGCATAPVKKAETTQPAPKPAASTIKKIYIPLQSDPNSPVIQLISQGLGPELTKLNPAGIKVVPSASQATCELTLDLQEATFKDSDWKEDLSVAASKVDNHGRIWKNYNRKTSYHTTVEFFIKKLPQKTVSAEGSATADVTSEAKLNLQRPVEEIKSGVKPKFPKVPGKPEDENALAIRNAQELVKKIAQEIVKNLQ